MLEKFCPGIEWGAIGNQLINRFAVVFIANSHTAEQHKFRISADEFGH